MYTEGNTTTATRNHAPAVTTYRIDANEVRRAVELLAPEVFELRVVNCHVRGEYRTGTYSGYFQLAAINELLAALERIEFASGTYFTPNAVNPALLARCYNRARIIRDNKEPTTADKDITGRRWLLIDVDAVRPAGVSSTDAEREATRRMAHDIDHHLWERGFPAGIIGDSGNGSHLMIPADLPADDKGFTQRLLQSLADAFDNEAAVVDVSTFNPARIWKLPGTLVCKGDNAPELGRPWRMSRIMTVCNQDPDNA